MHHFSCSAIMADLLPDDLLAKILYGFPIKTLMKLKLVSKSWYHLITYVCVPSLSSSKSHHHQNPKALFYCCRRLKNSRHKYKERESLGCHIFAKPCLDSPRGTESDKILLHSCNGLLLCQNRSDNYYYVCNPALKQFVAIPKPEQLRSGKHSLNAAGLMFDPSYSPDYRVVRFVLTYAKELKLDVFSSDTGRWVRHNVLVVVVHSGGHREIPSRNNVVYTKGMLYCLFCNWVLIRVNANAMTGIAIELPLINVESKRDKNDEFEFIGMSKRQLHYLNQVDSAMLVWNIWVLDDDEKPFWSLRHSFSMEELLHKCPLRCLLKPSAPAAVSKPCGIHPNDDVVFLINGDIFIVYGFQSNNNSQGTLATTLSFDSFLEIGEEFGVVSVHFYSACFVTLKKYKTHGGGPGGGGCRGSIFSRLSTILKPRHPSLSPYICNLYSFLNSN